MALITFSHIEANLVDVTAEQVGRCHKVFGPDNKAFYQVENSDGKRNDAGELVEYKVTYSKEHGFGCTCPSGMHGFANVKHASGVCWHVRASVACAIEERHALRGLVVVERASMDEELNVLIVEKTPMTVEEKRDDRRFNGGRAYGASLIVEMHRMAGDIFHK